MTDARPQAARFCKRCDYDLAASDGPLCPECGRAFSPADPHSVRAYPRRSWRGRFRRWRWAIATVLVLIILWPGGWSLTKVTWLDATGASTVEANGLVIGRPWWLGGWYAPIVWGSTTGSPPATPAKGTPVGFDDRLWHCASPFPWRYELLGRGRLSVLGPGGRSKNMTQTQWQGAIEKYVRTIARGTSAASAEDAGMSINAPVAPWYTDDPPFR